MRLDIKNLKFIGFITWLGKEYKDLGLLYETSDYTGKLIPENREGHLAWIDYEEFKKMDGMSLSMDKILKIYEGEYREIFWNINNEEISYIK